MSALATRPMYKPPPLVDLTKPDAKEDRVVEPVAENVPVKVVEAKTVLPETVKAVADAVVKLVCPLPHKMPEMEREVPEATPSMGVTKVGEVCCTVMPVPVVPLL